VLTWGEIGAVRLWDMSGHVLQTFAASTNPIRTAEIGVDGLVATVAYNEDVVNLWASDSESPVATLAAGYQSSIAFARDGTKLATLSGRAAKVWDSHTGTLLESIETSPGRDTLTLRGPRPIAVGFDASGTQLVTGTSDGVVRVWDASTGTLIWSSPACGGSFLGFRFVGGGTNLAVVTVGSVCLLDARTGELIVEEVTSRLDSARAIGVSADGGSIVAPAWGESVFVMDGRTGAVRHFPRP
jgi:WD40 repeat protein